MELARRRCSYTGAIIYGPPLLAVVAVARSFAHILPSCHTAVGFGSGRLRFGSARRSRGGGGATPNCSISGRCTSRTSRGRSGARSRRSCAASGGVARPSGNVLPNHKMACAERVNHPHPGGRKQAWPSQTQGKNSSSGARKFTGSTAVYSSCFRNSSMRTRYIVSVSHESDASFTVEFTLHVLSQVVCIH